MKALGFFKAFMLTLSVALCTAQVALAQIQTLYYTDFATESEVDDWVLEGGAEWQSESGGRILFPNGSNVSSATRSIPEAENVVITMIGASVYFNLFTSTDGSSFVSQGSFSNNNLGSAATSPLIPNGTRYIKIQKNTISAASITSITITGQPLSIENLEPGTLSGQITTPATVKGLAIRGGQFNETDLAFIRTSLTELTYLDLSTATLPNNAIPQGAFAGTSFATIKLPANYTSIGANAFENCGITEIFFPSSLESIGAEAFKGCTDLAYVNISNPTPPSASMGAFTNISATAKLSSPNQLSYRAAGWTGFSSYIDQKTLPWGGEFTAQTDWSEWVLTNATSSNTYLTINNGGTATLPEFAPLEQEVTLFMLDANSNLNVYASEDNTAWSQINQVVSVESGLYRAFTLPIGTKFVQIRSSANYLSVKGILITYSNELIYQKRNNDVKLGFYSLNISEPNTSLPITAVPVSGYGNEDILLLPNTKLPRTGTTNTIGGVSYYFYYYDFAYLYFKLANYDKSNVKLYLNETEIKDREINGGEFVMPMLDTAFRTNTLRAVSIDGNTPSLEISDLHIVYRPEAQIQTNPDYWFKNGETLGYTIGSGTFGRDKGWWFLQPDKTYNYTYKDVDNNNYEYNCTAVKIPYNINNDNTQDFYYNNNTNSGCIPLVFANNDIMELPRGMIGPVDYNQDGLTDFLYENFVMQQVADGTFKKIPLNVMSIDAYILREEEFSANFESATANSGGGFGIVGPNGNFKLSNVGSSFGMIGGFGVSLIASESAPPLIAFDYDGNGSIDILNNKTGLLMLNMGNGEYATIQMSGTISFRDLNGDGLLDFAAYDDKNGKIVVGIAESGGVFNTANPFTYPALDDIWFSDFDRDGHVDIILPISHDGHYAYMVILKNDGNGNFDVIEQDYTAALQFKALADLNGDGTPDVLAIDNATGDVVWLKGNKIGYSFDLQTTPLYKFSENYANVYYTNPTAKDKWGRPLSAMNLNAADVNQDGFYDLILNYAHTVNYLILKEVIPIYTVIEAVPNTPPQKPSAPTFAFDPASGFIKINWTSGSDAENSPVDLTYELCIGTSADRCDIYGANADAITGQRYNLQNGNMGYKKEALINASSWNSGNYYIKIQVIDPNRSGSAWSEAVILAKNVLPASFAISGEKNVIDNFEVSLTSPYDASLTYNWNLDGANVIDDGDEVKVINFPTPGFKKITLQTEKGGEKSQIFEQEIYIAANKFTLDTNTFNGGCTSSCNYYGIGVAYAYVDFKAEGKLAATTYDKLYQNDGVGKFSRAPGTFQNNISFNSRDVFADYNSDGLVDILRPGGNNVSSSELNVYVNTYTAGANFSFANTGTPTTFTLSVPSSPHAIADINGDGKLDIIFANSIYINNGDYQDYTRIGTGVAGNFLSFVDFDSDGKLDIVSRSSTAPYDLTLYKGNGDGTFGSGNVLANSGNSLYTYNDTPYRSIAYFIWADMNNDGYPDGVVHYKENESSASDSKRIQNVIRIFYNNGGKGFSADVKNIKLALAGDRLNFAYDFDNNGYLDLFISNPSSIIYFHSSGDAAIASFPRIGAYGYEIGYDNLLADLDGDGVEDLGRFKNNTTVTNTPPNPPTNVRYTQTDSTLLIEWDAATDNESPSQSLRYNASVKKKGATGADSYIISPLNKTTNGVRPPALQNSIVNTNSNVATPYNPYYRKSTRLEIPLSALVDGGEYDIQIQTLDLWNAPSDFSPVVTAKVTNDPQIRVPAAICAGTPATILYLGMGTPVWNWNGGVATNPKTNEYAVTWSTAGNKTISVNSEAGTADLLVMPPIDTEIILPSTVIANAEIPIALPSNGLLDYQFTNKNGSQSTIETYRKNGMDTAYIVFKAPGTHTITFTVNAPCGTAAKDYAVEAVNIPKAAISLVTAEGGNAKINWTAPANLPAITQNVNIYREGSKYNSFDLIATIPVATGSYTDPNSNTNITTNRYRIAYASADGYEGERSNIHKNLHLMINKGAGSAWNLFWGVYEGAIVETFHVLRGTDPDNLEEIGTVPGSTASFSDLSPPVGELYYAIAYDTPYQPEPAQTFLAPVRMLFSSLIEMFAGNTLPGATNIVSTTGASTAILATSLSISNVAPLTPEHYFEILNASIEPNNATYKNVNWSITAGSEYASIQNGILLINPTTTGTGTITIKAETIDGSEKSTTKTVAFDMPEPQSSSSGGSSSSSEEEPSSSSVEADSSSSSSDSDTPSSSSEGDITPARLPQIAIANQATQIYNGVNLQAMNNAVVEIFNLNGVKIDRQNFANGVYTIPFGHLPKGMYIVKVSFGTEKQMLKIPVR